MEIVSFVTRYIEILRYWDQTSIAQYSLSTNTYLTCQQEMEERDNIFYRLWNRICMMAWKKREFEPLENCNEEWYAVQTIAF